MDEVVGIVDHPGSDIEVVPPVKAVAAGVGGRPDVILRHAAVAGGENPLHRGNLRFRDAAFPHQVAFGHQFFVPAAPVGQLADAFDLQAGVVGQDNRVYVGVLDGFFRLDVHGMAPFGTGPGTGTGTHYFFFII